MNFYFYPRPPRGGRPARNRQPRIRRADFYPRPPRGGRPATIQNEVTEAVFLSTPSARRATRLGWLCCYFFPISIHALREEGDRFIIASTVSLSIFLSTPSARRATCFLSIDGYLLYDFYPRPPRGGRRVPAQVRQPAQSISIHALREEGDGSRYFRQLQSGYFYPRPPRGGRLLTLFAVADVAVFLSTPSARRATSSTLLYLSAPALFLSTPSARRATVVQVCKLGDIEFLSTPSARRATAKTETKSLFSNKLYNILHEFRRALIYNGSKNYPNHAK